MNKREKVILTLVILILLFLVLRFSAKLITNKTGFSVKNNYENSSDLLKCMFNKNVTLYGSKYCSITLKQKLLFDKDFVHVNYIECSANPDKCENLKGVPAWQINNNFYYGFQSFQNLKTISNC